MVACSDPCFVDPSAACFTDPRLRNRLQMLLDQLDSRPGCSLPQACQGWAATKAAYRFFAHPQTTVAHLLPAFVGPAVARASRLPEVIVPHDSTSFNFSALTQATGLGLLNDSPNARGLHLHSSLLLDGDGCLLGLGHLHFWVRQQFRTLSAEQLRGLPIELKESSKWLLGVAAIVDAFEAVGPRRPRLIHVMDREGDIHEVFAQLKRLRHDGVIRCSQNRRVQPEPPQPAEQPAQADYAKQQVARRPVLGRMELPVPLQQGGYRTAVVEVRSARVRLSPHPKRRRGRKPLSLGLIEVREVSTPPAGEKAARWWLWTTLPARTAQQVRKVLKIYRARWRLEEYHRALKTGCRVEELRLQSGEKLMKAITLATQVALRAVRLRDQVKQTPQGSCQGCFSQAEWQTLFARQHHRAWQPEDGVPTLEQVVRWLGRLGGHLGRKRDGLPGAEVLGRGLYALTLLVEGRHLGKAEAAQQPSQPEAPPPAGQRVGPAPSPPKPRSETHQHPHG